MKPRSTLNGPFTEHGTCRGDYCSRLTRKRTWEVEHLSSGPRLSEPQRCDVEKRWLISKTLVQLGVLRLEEPPSACSITNRVSLGPRFLSKTADGSQLPSVCWRRTVECSVAIATAWGRSRIRSTFK